jgi:enoyl-CoA hydratase/carnithine racemase
MPDQSVITESLSCSDGAKIGMLTLNAPATINSLTLPMVTILQEQLDRWRDDPTVTIVIIRGSGDRGFCAGGDVVSLRASSLAGDGRAAQFFAQEYRLDYTIHQYPKPIVVWGHGIVMGGGLGLLAGASHRIVTGQTRFAMPEVTIGLFPDVGATWFLNKMPGNTGLFLALTGASFYASDAVFLGLADFYLEHEQFPQLLESVLSVSWLTSADVHSDLNRLLLDLSLPLEAKGEVQQHFQFIQQCTVGNSVQELVEAIGDYSYVDDWFNRSVKTMRAGCPVTLAIVVEQLRRAPTLTLGQVFAMEWILAFNCMAKSNFAEGVRALLIDKDRKPRFTPGSLSELELTQIENYFQLPAGVTNPLSDIAGG